MARRADFESLFASLLEVLGQQGYARLPGERIQIRRLLSLQPEWRSDELAAALTSLLAKDPAESERLRRFLATWLGNKWDAASSLPDAEPPASPAPRSPLDPPRASPSNSRILRIFFGAAGVAGAVVFLYLVVPVLSKLIQEALQQAGGQAVNPQQPAPQTDLNEALRTFGLLFMVLAVIFSSAVSLRRRPPLLPLPDPVAPPAEPSWDTSSSARFQPGEIGGRPPAWLDRKVLDQLAQVPVLIETEEESEQLDFVTSVAASSRDLRPKLCFEKRRVLLRIVLLVDADAPALRWNPLPAELKRGLAERGLEVSLGSFLGNLATAASPEEPDFGLAAIERDQDRLLLLIFSDGAGLGREDEALLLRWSRFPRIAWLDPREPRFWDDQTELVDELGITLYPASAEGVAAAFDALLSPRQGQGRYSAVAMRRSGLRVRRRTEIEADVAAILGDALPWAQACAMIQPVTTGLAQRLRAKLYPELPAMAIGRLHLLPDTRATTAGMSFSDRVTALLRQGFAAQPSAGRDLQALAFILAELDKVRPVYPGARPDLAFLTWSAIYERVRLELEPDDAAGKLAALLNTPLGPAVRANLRKLIPLRLPPQTPEARALLEKLVAPQVLPRQKAGKNIILAADRPRLFRRRSPATNVERLLGYLPLKDPNRDQIKYCVQADAFRSLPFPAAGFAENVIDLYRFLASSYEPGDRIYLFGCGGGAAAIRALSGFIATCGLCDGRGLDESRLRERIAWAYYAYEAQGRGQTEPATEFRQPKPGQSHGVVPIEFLGVWDTVAGVGPPQDYKGRGLFLRILGFGMEALNWLAGLLYPHRFYHYELTENLRHACQALALDEERKSLAPMVWDELHSPNTLVEQVWFAGSHANVGGGRERDGLSNVALEWMMAHAEAAGLLFRDRALEAVRKAAHTHGRISGSRDGARIWRCFAPRDVEQICRGKLRGEVKLHGSVLERMRRGTANYAPGLLPFAFEQVGPVLPARNSVHDPVRAGADPETWRLAGERLRTWFLRRQLLQTVFFEWVILWAIVMATQEFYSWPLIDFGPDLWPWGIAIQAVAPLGLLLFFKAVVFSREIAAREDLRALLLQEPRVETPPESRPEPVRTKDRRSGRIEAPRQ